MQCQKQITDDVTYMAAVDRWIARSEELDSAEYAAKIRAIQERHMRENGLHMHDAFVAAVREVDAASTGNKK